MNHNDFYCTFSKTGYNKQMQKSQTNKVIGLILAAGKGTRINSHQSNKVCLPFANRPLIVYAVKLMKAVAQQTVVVVGAFAQSVKQALADYKVIYVTQTQQLGTAHAVKTAIRALKTKPDLVLVGYGDHMMFYQPETIKKLIKLHLESRAVMSLISCQHENPNELAWGRIIRDKHGRVIDSREQKDATDDEKQITELNAGFYCFDFAFLKANLDKIPLSPISKEYYLNSLVKIASDQGLTVSALHVPFAEVGIGINCEEELVLSEQLYNRER